MKFYASFCVIWVTFYLGIRAGAETAPASGTATPAAATVQSKLNEPADIKKSPKKIETLSNLRLVSIDQQIFILHEDETSWGVVPAISFAKGERVQRTFPAPVKDWQDWRTKFLQMMSSFPKAAKCPHPIIFQSEQQGENYKDKEVCLDELNKTQRTQLQQLTKEWSKFLYGS